MSHIIIDKEFLSQRSEEIDIKKERQLLNKIILDLKETLRENPNIIGLTASQIGYPKRVFVIKFNNELKTFINPLISKCTNGYMATEICASIPNKEFMVTRGNYIEFFYTTPINKQEGGRLKGYSAQIFQHLIDLLDGVMIDEYGIEMTEEIKTQTPEERKEMIEAYTVYLEENKIKLKQEVKEELNKALKDAK